MLINFVDEVTAGFAIHIYTFTLTGELIDNVVIESAIPADAHTIRYHQA